MSRATSRRGKIAAAGGAFSPLSLAWTHAHWAEGPEMKALAYANGATIGNWPDEVGTGDLVQATSGLRPTFTAASANWNSKPVVSMAAANGIMQSTFANLVVPFQVILLGRTTGFNRLFFDNGAAGGRWRIGTTSTPNWQIDGGDFLRVAGTPDTGIHMLRLEATAGTEQFYVDEVQLINATSGNSDLVGATVFNSQTAGQGVLVGDLAFVGIAKPVLSAGDIALFKAWAHSYYGTP